MVKKSLSIMIMLAMVLSTLVGFAETAATPKSEPSDFAAALEARYVDPDRQYGSDVRWWLGDAGYTDEVLLNEIQNLYDFGFHGVELCMQNGDAPDSVYAYGSEMWAHKWKLMMNALLDLGMEVSLTSGTNWSTSNVPGLDPDSQQASQVIAMGKCVAEPGTEVTALPKPDTMRASNKGQFITAYAYKLIAKDEIVVSSRRGETRYPAYTVDDASYIDLGDLTFTEGETVYDQVMSWTVPDDGQYVIFAFWTHGNYVTASPAAETCYATNYFDKRGVEALRTFWEANYLNDEELNAKILEGDVQLFMDSIELSPTGGITWWTEDIRQEFINRKGYDIMPHLFLMEGLPQVQAVYNPYYPPAQGYHELDGGKDQRERYINDWVDVLTQLLEENMLAPLKEWLNSVGIKTRAQISYGRSFEITEPSAWVDYPEAESFNQYDQIDIFRLHTAGAKLQSKMLSSETGTALPNSAATVQMRLHTAYAQNAAGFQRVIWHIWSTPYAFNTDESVTGIEKAANQRPFSVKWPGWGTGSFERWGDREPNSRDYDEFNAHIGRVNTLMNTGKARTDIGFIHNNWNQGVRFGGGIANDLGGMNYEYAHMGVYYRSTELQDNGYTYDYVSPDLLTAEGVYFDEATKTVEQAGYKALVIYQNWLDPDGAKLILDWAKQGLKVVVIEGAAMRTPFNDGRDEELAATMAELKALDTVRVATVEAKEGFDYFNQVADGYTDNVLACLKELGVEPYAGYTAPNHQLLSQSRVDEDGNEYLFVYNYCPNDYHVYSYIPTVQGEDHGTVITTEMAIDGEFVPYEIDAWSGKATALGEYRWEDGKTIFEITVKYDEAKLFAFEKADEAPLHVTATEAQAVYADGKLALRATQSGEYTATLSDGTEAKVTLTAPWAYDITGWKLTVESWTPGEGYINSTETIGDIVTVNSRPVTNKTNIETEIDTLTTWDNIPEVGIKVSGLGRYEASFDWDASAAAGAYLDFGDELVSGMKVWINGVKVGGDISRNSSKTPVSIVEGREPAEEYAGGISWTNPIVDIGEYLVDGQNTIVIEYSSSIGNATLACGSINVSANNRTWWHNDSIYRHYGPAQAVIVPYAQETIAE